MARTTEAFRNEDLVTYAMDGRMMVVKDGEEISLIVENVVRYSNRTKEGLIAFLGRQRTRPAAWMPEACRNNLSALIFKLQRV